MPSEFDPDQTDQLPAIVPQQAGSAARQEAAATALAGLESAPDGDAAAAQTVGASDDVVALQQQVAQQASELSRLEKELEREKSKRGRRRRAGGKGAKGAKQAERLEQLEHECAERAAQNEEQQAALGRLENELEGSRATVGKLQQQLAALGTELEDRARTLVAVKEELALSRSRVMELEVLLAEALRDGDASQAGADGGSPDEKHDPDADTAPGLRRPGNGGAARGPVAVAVRRYLVRLDPGHEALYELSEPCTNIGRTPENDLQVSESYISRSHAVVKLGRESAVIEDAGSSNGVFVNGRRVIRQLLRDGDTVLLGKARFRFETRTQSGA